MYYRPAPARRSRRRLSPRAIIIIIIAAIVGALGLLYYFDLLPGFLFPSTLQEMDTALPETVSANDKGILYNQNNTLRLLDSDGKELWNLQLEINEAETVTSDDLIVNFAGKTVQAMDYTKMQQFKTSLDGNILKAAAGKSSVAVQSKAQDEDEEKQSYLHLLNLAGEQTGQIDTPGNQQIIDFDFHGENDIFWVLSLDVSGVVPTSYITTYKSDGSQTNSIPVNSEVIEKVFFTDSSIYANGTNTLASYTYFSTKQGEEPVYGWKVAASSVQPASIRLAYIPRSKSPEIDTVRIYSTDLDMVHIRLPRNVFSLAITQNNLYAFTEDTAHVYSMEGTLIKEISLGTTITRMTQLSDSLAVVWDNQKSYLMDLQ